MLPLQSSPSSRASYPEPSIHSLLNQLPTNKREHLGAEVPRYLVQQDSYLPREQPHTAKPAKGMCGAEVHCLPRFNPSTSVCDHLGRKLPFSALRNQLHPTSQEPPSNPISMPDRKWDIRCLVQTPVYAA